jgi:hypothetical protein
MPSAPPEQPPAGDGGEDEGERYGPLIVRRMVKEDGRALIRFDRADGTRFDRADGTRFDRADDERE